MAISHDIKPSNFAIGRPEINELRKVYLLDFGMCRRYIDDNKQIRRPRSRAGFRGTIRYAPLSVHIRRETCRKDDIESWLYQQIEITRGALPWRSLEEKNEVAMFKERCRYGHCLYEMMGGCPRQYIEILKYVDSLRYYDVPNYNKIYKLLRTAIKLFKVPEFPIFPLANVYALDAIQQAKQNLPIQLAPAAFQQQPIIDQAPRFFNPPPIHSSRSSLPTASLREFIEHRAQQSGLVFMPLRKQMDGKHIYQLYFLMFL
uniref:Protein kinase domain-containing protein n=1 Tax=Panagrolaimus sp. PS1159 TaxID=55785 RepID=A0AC35GU66_9BILA